MSDGISHNQMYYHSRANFGGEAPPLLSPKSLERESLYLKLNSPKSQKRKMFTKNYDDEERSE